MGFFDKLKQGLFKSKISFSSNKVDENLMEELEEKLIMADVGFETTESIIDELKDRIKKDKLTETEDVKNALKDIINQYFTGLNSELDLEKKPAILLMIGVNGSRKNYINWKNCKQFEKTRKESFNGCS